MTKHEKDISQIKKYLEGKLDARSMYELERRAQDDPFLMDALEGYENAGEPLDQNLKELSDRLAQRTEKKERRIIPLRYIAIAASVLLVLFAGVLWMLNQSPSVQKPITKISVPPIKKPVDTLTVIPAKPTEIAKLNKAAPAKMYTKAQQQYYAPVAGDANADVMVDEPVGNADKVTEEDSSPSLGYMSTKKDTVPLNESVVMDYSTQQLNGKVAGISINRNGKDIKGMVRDANGPLPGVTVSVKGTAINTLTDSQGNFILRDVPYRSTLDITDVGYDTKQVMIKKQDSLIIAMQPAKNVLNEVVVIGYGTQKKVAVTGSVSTATAKEVNTNTIEGIVTDDTGDPLPGATVKIKGTSTGTVTDGKGKFMLHSATPVTGTILAVDYIGYEHKDIAVGKSDSLVIAMHANGNALSEVVTTGAQQEQQQLPARPNGGWDEFKKYLKDNAQSPDGKTGTVKVSFMVNPDNSLSDFKIINSISAKTDTAVIELIKTGPEWLKNTNNKPERVKVRVKFEAKK
jgi:hypothetical protein